MIDNDKIAKISTRFLHGKVDMKKLSNENAQRALRELWNAAKIGMVATGVKKLRNGRLQLTFDFYE